MVPTNSSVNVRIAAFSSGEISAIRGQRLGETNAFRSFVEECASRPPKNG